MRIRLILNVGLLLAIAGLAALALHDFGESPPAGRRVTDIDPAGIERVSLRAGQSPEVRLERTGTGWIMRAPYRAPAYRYRIEALLAALRAPSLDGFRAAGNDLAQFGLEPPRLRLEADGAVLLFGDTEPLDGRRYVLYDGEVHLVTDSYFHHLGAAPTSFVDPAPLGTGSAPVAFELPGGILVARVGPGWRTSPPDALDGADAGTDLAQAWRGAQALRVAEFDRALGWGPGVRVRIGGDAPPFVFEAARTGEGFVLGRRDVELEYHFLPEAGERLLPSNPLREPD